MNRIKELRVAKGLMQKELAKTAGVSCPFLCDLEKNRRSAKPETYLRIAGALGVPVSDLIVE